MFDPTSLPDRTRRIRIRLRCWLPFWLLAMTFLLMVVFVTTALTLDISDLLIARRALESELLTAALSSAYHLDGTPRGYQSARARFGQISERLVTPRLQFADVRYRTSTNAIDSGRQAIEVCVTAGAPISLPAVRVLLFDAQTSVVHASACAYIITPGSGEKL